MEIRVLRYFLEMAREGNMTRAAKRLNITQPTMSKQLKDLETELGQKLFTRTNYNIKLTEAGLLLRKRAENLLDMSDKIEKEFQFYNKFSGGDVYIGCAESYLIKYIATAIQAVQEDHPNIHYHFTSGDTSLVSGKLNEGLYDFALIAEPPDLSRYNYIEIPESNLWGVVMQITNPLASKQQITFEDLLPYPIFASDQAFSVDIPRWCGENVDKLNRLASFNLSTNSAFFTKEGLGLTLSFNKLIDTSPESGLVFRPLYPKLETKMYIIWMKYQVLTPAASFLLKELKK